VTSNKGKRRNTRKGCAKGGNGGRRSRSAISGYGAHAEAGSCRITTGIHLLEVMRCYSAGLSYCFICSHCFRGCARASIMHLGFRSIGEPEGRVKELGA